MSALKSILVRLEKWVEIVFMPKFGLIGLSLSHSFSKRYFEEKFLKLGLNDYAYELFELQGLQGFRSWFFEQALSGVNVTVPYKVAIIDHLDGLSKSAETVGAVNAISLESGKLIGHNTDVEGFDATLPQMETEALVLGSGGGSLAVKAVLQQRGMAFKTVSRQKHKADFSYTDMPDLGAFGLIVNATPLGMYPNSQTYPELDYGQVRPDHYGYDLVYNPEKTVFLSHFHKGQNGLAMLYAQAEAAWKIWNRENVITFA